MTYSDAARRAGAQLEAEGRAIIASLKAGDDLAAFAQRADLDDEDDRDALINLARAYQNSRTTRETERR